MSYFNQIFKKTPIAIDSPRYPYRLKTMRRQIDKFRRAFEILKEELGDVPLKDATKYRCEDFGISREDLGIDGGFMGDALLIDFFQYIFTDSIVQFGKRTPVGRRDFALIAQAAMSFFRHRFMWRHDSNGIYHEGDDIEAAISKRGHLTFHFCKIADSMFYSREFLEDQPISTVALDTAMSLNKTSMLEDSLCWHELTYISDSTLYPEFSTYNFQAIGNTAGYDPDSTTLLAALEQAILNLTARIEDPVERSQLRVYLSPHAYQTIYKDPNYKTWSVLGLSPTIITGGIEPVGSLPPPFGIPMTIIQPGFYDTTNTWNYNKWDMYLVANDAMAIRTRADHRMEPLILNQRMMEGWLMHERIRPYVVNPIRYIRIGENAGNPIQLMDQITYRPRDLSKDTTDFGSLEMISIQGSVSGN